MRFGWRKPYESRGSRTVLRGAGVKFLGLLTFYAVVFLLFITIFSSRLYCYIDPGTGSYIIQLIIAGLIGVSFAIKLFWKKIKNFFTKIFSKKPKK